MADYSRRYTKEVKTSGDLLIKADSDLDILCSNDLNATIGNKITLASGGAMDLNATGLMTLYDSSRTSGVTLADLQQEIIHEEIYYNGAVSNGGNNQRLDVFEQSFTGTHTRDFLEIWINFLVQDSAGSNALEWEFDLQIQEDGGGYSTRKTFKVQLDEVNNGAVDATNIIGITPPFSVPLSGYYVENIGIATVDTRLIQPTGAQGITLNAASSFRMRHSTKYHDFTVETNGAWETNS